MKPTLILVDDVVATREELYTHLQDKFDVLAQAGNGLQAVEAVKRYRPQLVLMDVVMPKMTGIEATREILKGPEPHPKIIILSGLKDSAVILKALEAGAKEFLFKPVDLDRMTQVLMNCLEVAPRV